MAINIANDKHLISEDESKPLVRNIGFIGSMFVDSSWSLLSSLTVLFLFIYTPSSTPWNFVLTGTQAVVLFLFLVPLCFVVSWHMLSQVRDDIRNEGFVLISPQSLMVVLGMPFVFIAVPLALLLSLIDIGLPSYYSLSIFYGFGLGMVVSRVLVTMTDMKRWMLLPIYSDSDIKRRRAVKWRITVRPHVSYVEQD